MGNTDIAMSLAQASTQPGADDEFLALRVGRIVPETADAVSVVLEVPEALTETFRFKAGQFLTLRAELDGEVLKRCYSMSSAPFEDELRITVKRVPEGPFSTWLTRDVRAGDVIEVSPPAGRFVLQPSRESVTAFAAGSGITPILSLAKTVLADPDRCVRIIYANRDADSVILGEELAELERRHGQRLQVEHRLDTTHDLLDAADVKALVGDGTKGEYYVCGPGGFMDAVEVGLTRSGVRRERLHLERFTLDSDSAGIDYAGLAPAGTTVTVTMGNQTRSAVHRQSYNLLRTVRLTGFRAPSSCEQGQCGTCVAKVVRGRVEMAHNDLLDEDEVAEGLVLVCQSWPASADIHIVYD